MTKSFKEYLQESKQNYEFKIKIAGDACDSASDKIKSALNRFNVESISEGKRTPIQESQIDFPEHTNIAVTIFDVSLAYPITSNQIRDLVSEALNITHSCVKVRNVKEQEEDEINTQYDQNNLSGKAFLGSDYEKTNHQSVVGEEHKMALLKELNKTKHQGTQYTGVNDELLAKKGPASSDKISKTTNEKISKSLFDKIVNTDPRKIK